jgi:hypothetical protein
MFILASHGAHAQPPARVKRKRKGYNVVVTLPAEIGHEVLEFFTDSEKGD